MSATLHNKLFLQSLLTRPSLPLPQALALFSATALAAHNFDADLPGPPLKAARDTRWNEFRHEINGQLEPLGLEVRQVIDEGDKGRWVVLVNTEADELAPFATVYTPLEVAYLKTLIRAIILAPSYTFSITRLTASRLASHLPNHPSSSLTRAGAEALVERFIAGGWLEVSKHKKRLSLACRSTAELEGYLEKEFPPGIDDDEDEDDGRPRILKCSVCKAIATKGKLCPSCPIDQPTAVHNHCLHKLLHRASAATSGSRGARHVHCPAQGEGVIWSEDGVAVDGELEVSWTELGEEAAGERDEAYVPPSKGGRSQKASSSRSKGKGKGKRTRTESDLESEDDDDDGDSEAARSKDTRQSSRISKSSSPVKKAVKGAKRPVKGQSGKKKARVSSDKDENEEDEDEDDSDA